MWPLSTRPARLRLVGDWRKSEDGSKNDQPDQPHGHLGGGWLAGSLAERQYTHQRPGLDEHRGAGYSAGDVVRARRASTRYSITWSARSSSVCGMVRPSALAVFMLMTNSNLVGCSTGRSPGFAPFRIFTT